MIEMNEGRARYILEKLIVAKKIGQRDVEAALSELPRDIAAAETRLIELRGGRTLPLHAAQRASSMAPRRRAVKRSEPLAPERKRRSRGQLASQKIQGQYMGLIRRFGGREREKFVKVRAEHGREVAIEAMRRAVAAQ